MTRILLRSAFCLAAVIGTMSAVGVAQAQMVSIDPTVTFSNGLYNYSYDVTNNTGDILAITTFDVRALPDAVQNPSAPAGFNIAFDSGLGLVSFFEDTDVNTPDTFASGSTVRGFMFSSPFAPTVSNFEALDINAQSFLGTTLAPANVPEPGTLALGATLALGTAGLIRTRRTRKAARA